MLRAARTAAAARIAAAIVAVTLSGAPRVVALQAPVEGHRCACQAHAGGQRDCDCALCRKAALAARARDQRLPPCHRTAEQEERAREDGTGSPATACIEGTCGGRDRPAVTIAGVDPFCLPAAAAVAAPDAEEERSPLPARLPERSIEPETPPPRRG